jgi:hypothetical protein
VAEKHEGELVCFPGAADKLSTNAEPPKRDNHGGRMARNRRFQQGSLFKRGSRTKVWVARWWEEVSGTGGKSERIRRSEIL